jgi:vitamin B12 transporter
MNKFSNLSLVAISAGMPLLASAASPTVKPDKLEEVVVTSSRVQMPLRQIGTSVSVLTEQDIQQLGFNSLYDVLRTQPGIGVTNSGGAGGVTSLRIRGEENYRTRVYLDDIDISDTSSPQFAPRLEHLLSSGIQRVEILRGPQGLVYGADAGGVVNISTLTPGSGLAGQASAEGGRYGTQQYAGNLGGGNDVVDFSMMAADFDTDGFNARTTDSDLKDDDGYENTTLHGRVGWNVTDDLRLQAVARDVEGDNEYDGCFNADFAETNNCRDEFDQQAWRMEAEYQTERFSHEIFYNNNEINRDFFSDGQFSFKLDGEKERVGYLGTFTGGNALKFIYGVDLENESIDDGFLDTDRDQDGYYLEYQGGFNDALFITAGARYDDNDDFGSHTSYRVSGAYLIPVAGGEMKLRATYGTGFRAPSLFEVATNANAFTLPPAFGTELEEEESEGYDLGLSWTGTTGLYMELVYFDQTIDDEIFYDFNSFGYLQASGDTQSNGVELIGDWPLLEVLSISGNYTYTDSEDINGDKRARRPEHMANLGINWEAWANRLVLGINARLSRDAVDVDGTELDDYEVMDINATFIVGYGLEVYGRVENVLDEDYEEVPTYNTGGAAGYLGLRYSF